MTPLIEARGLGKAFDGRVVLDSVDLSVPRGTVVSVLGRSGAGKTVLLKCLAGLMAPDAGTLRFAGRPLAPGSKACAEFRRRSRYVFQSNALFDALTALANVALPLEQTTTLAPAVIAPRAREALHRLGLGSAERRYPGEMSGGMQKRLALARALVTTPELVFFDEPTAGLDPLARAEVFALIARQSREAGFTAVVVTHDVLEALAASDRIALLDEGRVSFQGAPWEFHASDHPLARAFRGSTPGLGETPRSAAAAVSAGNFAT